MTIADANAKLRNAAHKLPAPLELLDDSGHLWHTLPSEDGKSYSDILVAWVVDRSVRPHLGAELWMKGSELYEGKSQEWFDEMVVEAINHLEPYQDGGWLPRNSPRRGQ